MTGTFVPYFCSFYVINSPFTYITENLIKQVMPNDKFYANLRSWAIVVQGNGTQCHYSSLLFITLRLGVKCYLTFKTVGVQMRRRVARYLIRSNTILSP